MPEEYFNSKTWEKSRIRYWLNHDFINKTFSSSQQNNILTVELENKGNPAYHTPNSNPTYDKIFFLSVEEALQYFSSKKLNTPIHYTEDHSKQICPCYLLDKYSEASLTPYAIERLFSYDSKYKTNKDLKAGYYRGSSSSFPLRTYVKNNPQINPTDMYRYRAQNGFVNISHTKMINPKDNYAKISLYSNYNNSIRPAMWLKLYN